MRVVVDRPADHQIWTRAELLAGWIEGVPDAEGLRARCGEVELVVRPCLHPRGLDRPDLHGFWTELVLQRHREAVRDGRLRLEIFWRDRIVAAVPLVVTPVARELADTCPLDLAIYDVPPAPGGATPPSATLVFPGLGGVGGSSLNALFRSAMLREGWTTPVYDEANAPALWARVQAARPRRFRWIDGHACYGAGDSRTTSAARITLLREPVRRMASVYNYGTLVHPEQFAGSDFGAFVASETARRHSLAAGLLRAAGRPAAAELTGPALHRAARAALVEGYDLVGITESFEETIFLACRLAGCERIGMWRRVLAAPRAVDPDALPGATRRRLVEALAPDLELYEETRAVFAARVAAAAFGPALVQYRAAAAGAPELWPAAKAVECLRWRQVLAQHAAGLTIASEPADDRAA